MIHVLGREHLTGQVGSHDYPLGWGQWSFLVNSHNILCNLLEIVIFEKIKMEQVLNIWKNNKHIFPASRMLRLGCHHGWVLVRTLPGLPMAVLLLCPHMAFPCACARREGKRYLSLFLPLLARLHIQLDISDLILP